jgi:hypothetical protein
LRPFQSTFREYKCVFEEISNKYYLSNMFSNGHGNGMENDNKDSSPEDHLISSKISIFRQHS